MIIYLLLILLKMFIKIVLLIISFGIHMLKYLYNIKNEKLYSVTESKKHVCGQRPHGSHTFTVSDRTKKCTQAIFVLKKERYYCAPHKGVQGVEIQIYTLLTFVLCGCMWLDLLSSRFTSSKSRPC
jgi:hypothetical protein